MVLTRVSIISHSLLPWWWTWKRFHMRALSQTNMHSCVHFSPSGCWRGKLLSPTHRKLWSMSTNVLKYWRFKVLVICGVKAPKLNVLLCCLFIFRDLPQVPANIYRPACNSRHKLRVSFIKWALRWPHSAWRRKELVHPPKKTGRLFPRRVEGQRRVTSRLCLFSVSPPGSVSDCGGWRETRLCCRREAVYLRALWKNKLTAGQAVRAHAAVVACTASAAFIVLAALIVLTQTECLSPLFILLPFLVLFCPPGPLSSWMRSWSWSLSVMEVLNTQGKLFLVSLSSFLALWPLTLTVFCSHFKVVIDWKHLIDWLDEGRLWPTLYASFMS